MIDINKLLNGDMRTLSKAITLTESSLESHQNEAENLIESILEHTGKSKRIGISGTPGVGKSSFIEKLGLKLIENGHKVAVLAIDPSSPVSGGSILGDKTRMEKLSQSKNAYIRPTPSSGTLGGVAQKSREAMLLCEAAGYDIILIETVGVGQSEVEVSNLVDIFTVMLLPGGGDELQGIKKGIIEIADCILINKADGDNVERAQTTKREYQSALNIVSSMESRIYIETTSSQTNHGIDEFINYLNNFFTTKKEHIHKKRVSQNIKWLNSLFYELINRKISSDKELSGLKSNLLEDLKSNKTTPIKSAKKLVASVFTKDK